MENDSTDNFHQLFAFAKQINGYYPSFCLWPFQGKKPKRSDDLPLILVSSSFSLPDLCRLLSKEAKVTFCWSPSFSVNLITGLWYEGFFPITTPLSDIYVLLPKIHRKRCVLKLKNFKIRKSVWKKSRDLSISFDSCFAKVCDKIVEQHGHNWLCPPLIKTFQSIFENNGKNFKNISLHSVELWKNKELVAGEIGVIIGTMYLSLTGFKNSTIPGAGSVQLYSLFAFLFLNGIDMIDLGMEMEYKTKMGARLLPRQYFLATAHQLRHKKFNQGCFNEYLLFSCKDVLKSYKEVYLNTLSHHIPMVGSKRQRKRLEKNNRKNLYRNINSFQECEGIFWRKVSFEETGSSEIPLESLTLPICLHLKEILLEVITIIQQKGLLKVDFAFKYSDISVSLPHHSLIRSFDYVSSFCFLIFSKQGERLLDANDIGELFLEKLAKHKMAAKLLKQITLIDGYLCFNISDTLYSIWSKSDLVENVELINVVEFFDEDSDVLQNKSYILDYSSPNLAKMFHVGHLRSTLLGDFVKNLLNYIYKNDKSLIVSYNHVGDWGVQFGMILHYVFDRIRTETAENLKSDSNLMFLLSNGPFRIDPNSGKYVFNPKYVVETDVDSAVVTQLMRCLTKIYQHVKLLWDGVPQFKTESLKTHLRLQQRKSPDYQLWQFIRHISLLELNSIYEYLGVKDLECLGESSENLHEWVEPILLDLYSKGIAVKTGNNNISKLVSVRYKSSDGSYKSKVIRKTNGTIGYAMLDLCAAQYRLQRISSVKQKGKLIYFTDKSQYEHFNFVFSTCSKAGWFNQNIITFEFIPFGVFLSDNNQKLKSRTGEAMDLREYFNHCAFKCKNYLSLHNFEIDGEDFELFVVFLVRFSEYFRDKARDRKFNKDSLLDNTIPLVCRINLMYVKIISLNLCLSAGQPSNNKCLAKIMAMVDMFLYKVWKSFSNYSAHFLCNYLFLMTQFLEKALSISAVTDDKVDKTYSNLWLRLKTVYDIIFSILQFPVVKSIGIKS